jgi:hypothetical protein
MSPFGVSRGSVLNARLDGIGVALVHAWAKKLMIRRRLLGERQALLPHRPHVEHVQRHRDQRVVAQ